MDDEERLSRNAYMRQYYADNPEKREWQRQYHRDRYAEDTEHRERIRERAKVHYQANGERLKAGVRERQMRRKAVGVALLGGKCQRCSEDRLVCLQFHHRDPTQKRFTLASSTFGSVNKYPWEEVRCELEKCDLLCANCHFKEHSGWHENMSDDSKRLKRLYEQALEWAKVTECPCGEADPAALQFHHRDPSQKTFPVNCKTLSACRKYPEPVLRAEIAKCDVICANCHFAHHSVGGLDGFIAQGAIDLADVTAEGTPRLFVPQRRTRQGFK